MVSNRSAPKLGARSYASRLRDGSGGSSVNSRFRRAKPFRTRNGTTTMAQTPVLREATSVGVLSAQLRRPSTLSATSPSRRFETSLERLKCANSGHSRTVQKTSQVDPELPLPVSPEGAKNTRKLP